MNTPRPLLLLDIDDVLCLNDPYGGYALKTMPPGIWERLFHRPAVEVLDRVMREHVPHVVITSSWLSFLERPAFEQVFRNTGLGLVADNLHPAWETTQHAGQTRCAAIDRWFYEYAWPGQPYVILDDYNSGTGLQASKHELSGRVVFCEEGVGLSGENWKQISLALDTPPPLPWEGFSKPPGVWLANDATAEPEPRFVRCPSCGTVHLVVHVSTVLAANNPYRCVKCGASNQFFVDTERPKKRLGTSWPDCVMHDDDGAS